MSLLPIRRGRRHLAQTLRSGGARRPRPRPLHFESLEARALLATLGMGIRFLQDDPTSQTPSSPINTITQIPVGGTFWVELRVQDVRAADPPAPGVIALPLDISWTNPSTVQFAGTPPGTAPNPNSFIVQSGNPLLTDKFPLQRFVDSQDGSQGAFPNLRAGSLPDANPPLGSPIGVSDLEWFSRLRFQAVQAPTAGNGNNVCFTSALAGSMSFADAAVLENPAAAANACLAIIPRPASLSGFVYADADLDGVRDVDADGQPIELGLPLVSVRLVRQDQTAPDIITTTGPDGGYRFGGVSPGTYTIRETPPTGFRATQDTLGIVLPGGESRGTVGQREFTNVTLGADEHGIDYNFGNVLWPVTKLLFLASTPSAREVLAERLGVTSVTVSGTAGSDRITVDRVGDQLQVVVNDGPAQSFSISPTKVVTVDALGGDDTVMLRGLSVDGQASSAEAAQFQPGYVAVRHELSPSTQNGASFRAWDYAVEVLSAEHISADPGTATLTAVLRDSPGNDQLTVGSDTVPTDRGTATMVWAGGTLTGKVTRLATDDTVRAISVAGGQDTIDEQTHDYLFESLGDWVPG